MTILHRVFSAILPNIADSMTTLTPKSARLLSCMPERAGVRLGRLALEAAVCLGFVAASVTTVVAQQTPTAQPIILADFNHDGIPDALVVSTTASTATIAFGSVPYGTFNAASRAVTFPSACTSLPQGSVLAGDFNNDGFADIAFFCSNTEGVMLGNGDGTFGAVKPLTVGSSQLAVLGDFNKDGKLDIAVIGLAGDSIVTQNIQFLAGKGDGTFAAAIISTLSQQGFSAPVVADIDGDGYPDIVLLVLASNFQMSPSLNVIGNNKDGTFGIPQSGYNNVNASINIDVTVAASTVLAGNFFGNNVNDLIIPDTGGNPGLELYANTSSIGNFSFADVSKTTIAGMTAALPGFFSGSGATDLVISNGTTISVLNNSGSGDFETEYTALAIPSTNSLFAVADANGDGYSDIYTATSTNGALSLAANVTTGSATATSQPLSLGIGTKAVSAAWNGNVNFLTSTATGQQIVTGALAATTVTSSKNPSILGDTVTFTASVVPAIAGRIPTGNVVFSDGATALATVALGETGTATYATAALTQATHPITVAYVGDSYFATSTSPVLSQVVNHVPAVASNLTWATPAAIVYGTALSATQLNATALDATGAAIPGTFAYTPAIGTVLDAGARVLSVTFTPTDLQSFLPATQTVTLSVAKAVPVVTWPTPTTIAAGTPLSATQLNASVVGVAGAALPGVFTYTPPAGTVLAAGTQTLSVMFVPTNALDYANATGTVSLIVAPSLAATITAPPTTEPGSQTTITVTLAQPYPVDLVGTLTIGFTRSTTPQLTDPSLQFAEGGTTLTFPIPANTTIIPPIELQAGTIAGTITVPLTLTAAGVNVTPADLPPVTIVVPPAVPSVSGMTVTRSGDQLTVVIHGFSNTREVASAKFHFTAADGATIGTPDLTLPADTIFNANWFNTDPSDAYGSTFTYTQIFNTSDGAANIGSVDATLTNTIGASTTMTAK